MSAAQFATLTYWRKNVFWGGSTVPVVIHLVGGEIRIIDQGINEVFRAPVAGLDVERTRVGTIVFRGGGKKLCMVPVAAKLSPKPSREQIVYVTQISNTRAAMPVTRSAPIGVVNGLSVYSAGVHRDEGLLEALVAQGATVRSRMKSPRSS